jgi:hypothetical protein
MQEMQLSALRSLQESQVPNVGCSPQSQGLGLLAAVCGALGPIHFLAYDPCPDMNGRGTLSSEATLEPEF